MKEEKKATTYKYECNVILHCKREYNGKDLMTINNYISSLKYYEYRTQTAAF